jgi:hypothetical protein
MGSTLLNTTPQNTYPSLIKLSDNLPLSSTMRALSDGNGNDLPLLVSTTGINNRGGGSVLTNTAFGGDALLTNVSGVSLTAIGYEALKNNTASFNTSLGFQSMLTNSTGANNSAFGYQTLYFNSTGSSNTAFGHTALQNNTA